jgi:hypothetical protein
MRFRMGIMAAVAAAGLAACAAAPAGAATEHYDTTARSAMAASCTAITGGDGLDLPLYVHGHGVEVTTGTGAGTCFTVLTSTVAHVAWEFRSPDGNCLTNNSGAGNFLFEESCPSDVANSWYTTPTHLLQSVELVAAGQTGNMTALVTNPNCAVGGLVVDEGGHPLECQDQWAWLMP